MKKLMLVLLFPSLMLACGLPQFFGFESQDLPEPQNTPQASVSLESTPLPAEINAPLVESPSLVSIEMFDEANGWGVTATQIVRTNDGGVSWYDVTPLGLNQAGYSIVGDYLDLTNAWVQAPDPNQFPNVGTIYRTSDGGLTWSSVASPFGSGEIAFIDQENGWMMADLSSGAGSNAVSIFQSTDGGNSWARTYTNDPNLEGSSDTLPLGGIKGRITPISMQTAWIGGFTYAPGTVYLYRTDDQGKTWSRVEIALSPEAQAGDIVVDQLKFISNSRGFLSLRVGGDTLRTVFYTTDDGGNTWTPAAAEIPDAGQLDIISAQELVFYGSDQFYVTRDGAKTWSIIPPDVSFADIFSSMSFANSSIGWVLTSDSSDHRSLYKTTDGAATWYPIIP